MIHYRLRCGSAHEFEGWFRDSGAFEAQAAGGLLTCPQCGTSDVARGLMAPSVRTRAAAVPHSASAPAETPPAVPVASGTPPTPLAVSAATLPDAIRAGLQRLRREIEERCVDVGDGFVEEARRMHYGDAPERGIYGNATTDDYEALADEGIEIARIPWLNRAES